MEKLNCKSLMIGDWVVYNGDVEYTDPIRVEGMDIATDMLITSDREDVGFDGVEPIPLTTEILEKNGFVKEPDADGLHYWFTLIDKHTKFSVFYARSVFQWLGPLDFKYVHELQHALRLCGIKKEIVL